MMRHHTPRWPVRALAGLLMLSGAACAGETTGPREAVPPLAMAPLYDVTAEDLPALYDAVSRILPALDESVARTLHPRLARLQDAVTSRDEAEVAASIASLRGALVSQGPDDPDLEAIALAVDQVDPAVRAATHERR